MTMKISWGWQDVKFRLSYARSCCRMEKWKAVWGGLTSRRATVMPMPGGVYQAGQTFKVQ